MGADPSFPFYASDWLGSNRRVTMTLAEQGALVNLLARMWNDIHCSLPDDDIALARLSELGDDWARGSGTLLRECLVSHPHVAGRLTHPKMLRARQERDAWKEKSRQGGRKSAAARSTKHRNGGSTTGPTVVQPPLEAPYQANGQPNGNSPLPRPLPRPSSSSRPSPRSKNGPASAGSGEVLPVFDHYRKLHPKAYPHPQIGDKAWKNITQRLSEGFTVVDLCAAIDGAHRSPFHCGQNETGQKYLGLDLITRDAGQVQKFMEIPHGTVVLGAKSQATKRAGQNFLANRMGAANGEG
jgi:hypothetical protein